MDWLLEVVSIPVFIMIIPWVALIVVSLLASIGWARYHNVKNPVVVVKKPSNDKIRG